MKIIKKTGWRLFIFLPNVSYLLNVWKNIRNSFLYNSGFFYKKKIGRCFCSFNGLEKSLNLKCINILTEIKDCKNLIEIVDILFWTFNKTLIKKKQKQIVIKELNEFFFEKKILKSLNFKNGFIISELLSEGNIKRKIIKLIHIHSKKYFLKYKIIQCSNIICLWCRMNCKIFDNCWFKSLK